MSPFDISDRLLGFYRCFVFVFVVCVSFLLFVLFCLGGVVYRRVQGYLKGPPDLARQGADVRARAAVYGSGK